MAQPMSVSDIEMRVAETRALITAKWGWFLALGIVLIIAGLAAIAFPLVSTIAAKVMLGWLFLIGGVMMIIHAFQAPGWQGFLWELLIGILYAVAGGYLAFFPLTGLLTLAILLAMLFIAEGVFEVIMAVRVRPHEGWIWLLLSGIAALAVGVIIAMGLPESAVWALGLLVGINLLFSGWSYVFLALAGRRAHEAAAAR
ncbi:MAG: HdeD family acid-resistance protein [Hyphomicrobium sp.]|uniref:HdeD family acid-resistance protein n=2 Tax=Hyphomicrobium sp. TaxID=82 RepID=UPI0025C47B94|nr:HdeD family acid-resistance protein [Hyphomicrobium sp.]MBZ0209850.1 HdeD family acid-resistance protein [Hyphomicrobium sp.]